MNPYEKLQVDPKANGDTIRKAYRKRAAKVHPDNHGTGNETEFMEVVRAFKLLDDPEQRALYDETGIATGDDKLFDRALTIILGIVIGIIGNGDRVEDLPALLKATVRSAIQINNGNLKRCEKVCAEMDERWTGAAEIKAAIQRKLQIQIGELNALRKVYEKAVELLADAQYAPKPNEELDNLMALFRARTAGQNWPRL
jgi:curved DNA-binding protein CbpA